jgi:hypothetical protein
MTVILQSGYSVPGGSYSLDNARILHSGNWATGQTVTANTPVAGYTANSVMNSLTYERYKPSVIPAEVRYTWGAAKSIATVCVAAHTLSGYDVAVQYWTGAAWANVVAATTIPDNSPIMWIFLAQSATQFRIYISAGPGLPEVGVMQMGNLMQLPISIFGNHLPIEYGRQTMLRSNKSDTGEFLGRTKQRVMLAASASWQYLPRTWVDTYWEGFQQAVESEPFFIAWRPSDSQSVGYCQVDEVPSAQFMGVVDYMTATVNLRGLADYG